VENGAARPPAAIRVQGLTHRYGRTPAVDGLDLSVRRGEVYGFLGPNGAGKSTVIRVLCTLLVPTGGHAEVAGHDVVADPQAVRLKIGTALQDAALDERLTGRELLELQARLYGLRRDERRRRLGDVLDLVNLGSAVDRRIASYSGGMKRRIDLAAALVHNPEVLFLDEPTTGLDPEARAEVWEEVRHLNRAVGLTVFLTTQYLDEADVLADRIGIIRQGRLVVEGSPEELKRLTGNDVIRIVTDRYDQALLDSLRRLLHVHDVLAEGTMIVLQSTDASQVVGPLTEELQRAGIRVRSLRVVEPSLDEVFMRVVGSESTAVAR
jgi:ABC-2 type transport system ATP-binding protein